MKKASFIFFIFYILLLANFTIGGADIDIQPQFSRYGKNVLAAFNLSIPEPYHAYSHDPGSSGLPTTLEFTLEGEGKMPVLYPPGTPEKDTFDQKTTVNVYNNQVTLLAILPESSTGSLYAANLDMLLCSTRHCLPFKKSITGTIPQKIPALAEVDWNNQAHKLLKQQNDSMGTISVEEGVAPPPLNLKQLETASTEDKITSNNQIKPLGPQDENVIDNPEHFALDLNPQFSNINFEIYSLGKALLLGVIAGLLLNAMPCVLPVLTLKVTGLLLLGNLNDKKKLKDFREHNLFFAAGVLTFFTILAILLGAADLMWGQLYQSQTLLLIMLLLVFLMGLSMLGVFTLPALDLKIGENTKNPRLKSYITGFISTFLATPCSGPLLGGVLAWAFTQPLSILLAIFWSVGAGMALPYIAFSIWPNMARILPRPGNWMYVFEHILGFLLLATALYLFSILPQEKHMHILIVLLCISIGAWLWGKFCGLDAPTSRRRVTGILSICVMIGAMFWILSPAPPHPTWQNFSPKEFVEDLGKKNMLVEFTADWCPNCKFLEATVLTGKDLRVWQKNYGLELVKVDLTRSDPYAQRLLQMLGSKSIPLTAIFAKGKQANNPLVLRDIYGKKTLDKALNNILAGT